MKKLMIAAAVAAIAGATFAECSKITCASAWRVKLSGKTCTGKTAGSAAKCNEDCWLKPTTLRIAGYFYGYSDTELEACESCACQENFIPMDAPLLWDANKKQVNLSGAIDVAQVLRNGGDKKKAALGFTLGNLYCAGFGTMSYKTYAEGLLKTANGFFAGTLDAPTCAGAYDAETCSEGDPTPAKCFTPCAVSGDAVEAEKAIAFGRWSLTWKQDKVEKMQKTGTIDCLYPAAFKATEE